MGIEGLANSPSDRNGLSENMGLARQAAKRAYNPYSRFAVGCILVDEVGNKYAGCNIESASYSVTLCAERVAGSQAIANGSRSWKSIYIVSPTRVAPCGVCRQFLYEFAPDIEVFLGDLESDAFLGPIPLRDLLPFADSLQSTVLGEKRPNASKEE
ncbi:MAG: cytidine deaminase [Pirellula sp.]|jgi:cytidine deaminase